MKILIIEDERHLSEAIEVLLKKENYIVDACLDGISGLDAALTNTYDLILLDIMLPKLDGLNVLKALRNEHCETPVLLLTARNQVSDRVTGLNLGADDYLSKPFAYEELLARVKAILRRSSNSIVDERLSYGDLKLDYHSMTLFCQERPVTLTLKESELLQLLMLRKQMITPKELIIEKLWGFESDADDNNVIVYISFLRKKLKYLGSKTNIKTTRGVGYSLEVKDV